MRMLLFWMLFMIGFGSLLHSGDRPAERLINPGGWRVLGVDKVAKRPMRTETGKEGQSFETQFWSDSQHPVYGEMELSRITGENEVTTQSLKIYINQIVCLSHHGKVFAYLFMVAVTTDPNSLGLLPEGYVHPMSLWDMDGDGKFELLITKMMFYDEISLPKWVLE